MAKKAVYKRFNGSTWEEYYFKTSTDMVEGLSSEYVKISDSQTITGSKTFSSNTMFNTGIYVPQIYGKTGMPGIKLNESTGLIEIGDSSVGVYATVSTPLSNNHIANKKYVDDKIDGTIVPVVGYSSTAAGTTAKVASASSSQFKMSGYKKGQIYIVQFVNGNTALNPTLNINSYGAKTIRQLTTNGSTTNSVGSSSMGLINIPKRAIVSFLYDGTYMIPIGVATNQEAKSKLYIDQLYTGTQQMNGLRQILLEALYQWEGLYDQFMMTVTIRDSMGDVLETYTLFNSIPTFVKVGTWFTVGVDDINIDLYIEGDPSKMYEVSIWGMTV